LIAGTADRTQAAAVLPQLDAVLAYPTAIFIDRTGRVREIHTGFAGPATAVQHDLLAHEFATWIEELLQAGANIAEPTVSTTEPPLSP
jgi:hypothetical protein